MSQRNWLKAYRVNFTDGSVAEVQGVSSTMAGVIIDFGQGRVELWAWTEIQCVDLHKSEGMPNAKD